MENNKTQLTDQQLDEIVTTLSENKAEDDKLIQQIINGDIDPETDLESEIIDVSVDPETGELKYMNNPDPLNNANLGISDVVEGGLEDRNVELRQESIEENMSKYNLTDDEAKQLLEVLVKYQTGEKFNVYNELPDPIKGYVDEFIKAAALEGNTNINKNQVAKFFLDEFIKDTRDNQEFVDLQTAIEKELQIPTISDMYSEHIKDIMEVKLLESADKLEEEYPDRAAALRAISDMFKESYTFGLMRSTLYNNKKARNKIRESTIEYNKYCNAFNNRNKGIMIKINDVFMVAKTLNRVLPDTIPLDDIKKFVVLFCKTCEELDVNNTVHCSYMYYTIRNIIALDHTNEALTDFSANLVANIISTIDFINETQQKIEASMPEKLLKKKIKKCSRG